jgi:hypothetical protein
MEISRFCSSFSQVYAWSDVVVSSAATICRIERTTHLREVQMMVGDLGETELLEVQWIYSALDYVQNLWEEGSDSRDSTEWDESTTVAVQSLLQVLACTGTGALPPPSVSIHVIASIIRSWRYFVCSGIGSASGAPLVS